MLKKILIAFPVVLIAGLAALYFFVNQQSAVQLDRMIEQAMATGQYRDISYESVRVGMNGEITVNNLSITDHEDIEYVLNEVVITDYDYMNEFPHRAAVTVTGLSLPNGLQDAGLYGDALDQYLDSLLDGNTIPLTINYRHDYNPESSYAMESEMSVSLPAAAHIAFTGTSRNIPMESLAGMNPQSPNAQANMFNILAQAEVPEIGFTVQDLGIVEQLIRIRAEESGQAVETVRARARDQVRSMILYLPPGLQNTGQALIVEVNAFLDGGKTFRIVARPENNGSIRLLQPAFFTAMFSGDYSPLVDALNLDFETQ